MSNIDEDREYELSKESESHLNDELYKKLESAIDGDEVVMFSGREAAALGLDNIDNAVSESDALDAMCD